MDETTINAIKNCKIFAALDPHSDTFKALASEFQSITLNKGQTLFKQGDPSLYFYILIKGKLAAYLSAGDKKLNIVGNLLPEETVGELGAISGDPRSLTIKATDTSELLRLSSDTFQKLARQFPSILFEALHPVISRSQQIVHMLATGEKKKHIAIIPANNDVNLEKFENKLRDAISHCTRVVLLTENHVAHASSHAKVNELIHTAIQNNIVIIYLLKSMETALSKACWENVIKIYVVADGNTPPAFSHFTLEKLHNKRHLIEVRRELILLYKEDDTPRNTHKWFELADFTLHHQVRLKSALDFQRVLRFMRGEAVGLVLSGGGAKGWAHIGALKALLEYDIPIDAIGGVSAGALVGSLYAMSRNYEDTHKLFEKLLGTTAQIVSRKNFCWPAISLFDCNDFTLQTQEVYRDIAIENLWIPFFCVTCNLGQYRETNHFCGLLWEKTRASVAVPGLVPPMVLNGEMHVDGGVVNNLPVNTMRDLLGPEGKIIAVELLSQLTDEQEYNFPPTLSFKEAFLAKLRLGYRHYKFPPFMETFIKSLLIGASLRQKENSAAADLLIDPNTTGHGMLRLQRVEEQGELIKLGYENAIEKISVWDVKK